MKALLSLALERYLQMLDERQLVQAANAERKRHKPEPILTGLAEDKENYQHSRKPRRHLSPSRGRWGKLRK